MSTQPLRWRRKWQHDAATDGWSPIPLQVVSNEEYAPPPQTRAQAEVAHHLREAADRHARALGMSRRRFLGSTCGMAAAFLAMNRVYGDDPRAHLGPVPKDFVSRMKAAYLEEGARPSLTQYGWVLAR